MNIFLAAEYAKIYDEVKLTGRFFLKSTKNLRGRNISFLNLNNQVLLNRFKNNFVLIYIP